LKIILFLFTMAWFTLAGRLGDWLIPSWPEGGDLITFGIAAVMSRG
jgi:hypothetical protein